MGVLDETNKEAILCSTGPLRRPRCISQCLFDGYIVTCTISIDRSTRFRLDVLATLGLVCVLVCVQTLLMEYTLYL